MRRAAAALIAAGISLAACGHGNTENEANASPPPAEVVVATVRAQTVPISNDYEGALGSIDSVELRARVEGTLERAPFKEGALVHKGDVVFQTQQNQYVAALQAAQGQLATAQGNEYSREAALQRANTTVARDRPLAADKAIPQKDLDNAIQSEEIAKGDVAAAKAAVLTGQAAVDDAKINLGYTTIRAPVTGLIGFLNYDVGNVVGGPSTQVLDTISAIDPIKVTFALDEPTYLSLFANRNSASVSGLADQDLRLVMANDKTYAYHGQRSTRSTPPSIRRPARSRSKRAFPIPDGLLRPGGFVRVRVVTENRSNAVLVPQTAITKSQGVDTVYVVDDKNEVVLKSVTLGPQYQQSFVAQSGLKAGDRVIVEGTQKVQPGAKVVIKTN